MFTGLGPTLTALFLAILTLYKAPKTAVFECLAVCDLFIPTVSTREKSPLPCKEAEQRETTSVACISQGKCDTDLAAQLQIFHGISVLMTSI